MANNPKVSLETSQGTIILELDAENAPISTDNFLAYVQSGFYADTIFHRVIPGFMIQGGGMNADMEETHGKTPIKNEAANGLKNLYGTIAMARTQVVDSATSQFFINVNDNDFLNHRDPRPEAFGYAVFGKVVEGMDVVHAIEKVATGNKGYHQDVPLEPITILKASVVEG
nr:peptidylprolyl isomerase [uncultured Desulfuromonas sp.]